MIQNPDTFGGVRRRHRIEAQKNGIGTAGQILVGSAQNGGSVITGNPVFKNEVNSEGLNYISLKLYDANGNDTGYYGALRIGDLQLMGRVLVSALHNNSEVDILTLDESDFAGINAKYLKLANEKINLADTEPITVSAAGWYKICLISSSGGRGNGKVSIYITGGSYVPQMVTIIWGKGYNPSENDADIITYGFGLGTYMQKTRFNYIDSSHSYLEVYFSAAISAAMFRRIELQEGFRPGNITWYSGSLPLTEGGSIWLECLIKQGFATTSSFYCGNKRMYSDGPYLMIDSDVVVLGALGATKGVGTLYSGSQTATFGSLYNTFLAFFPTDSIGEQHKLSGTIWSGVDSLTWWPTYIYRYSATQLRMYYYPYGSTSYTFYTFSSSDSNVARWSLNLG